jgi:hypothetical protein
MYAKNLVPIGIWSPVKNTVPWYLRGGNEQHNRKKAWRWLQYEPKHVADVVCSYQHLTCCVWQYTATKQEKNLSEWAAFSKYLDLCSPTYNAVITTPSRQSVTQHWISAAFITWHECWIVKNLEQLYHRLRLVVIRPVICYPACGGSSRLIHNTSDPLSEYIWGHTAEYHNLNASVHFQVSKYHSSIYLQRQETHQKPVKKISHLCKI